MIGRTSNRVVIDAPLQLVWELTNDVPNWPNLFTEYESTEVIQQTDDTTVFRLTMKPDEAGIRWSWVSERIRDERTRTVRAFRVETGPFEFMHIFWSYFPSADGTGTELVWDQRFRMRPSAPVNDEQMTDRINTNTPLQMAAIKATIEERLT